MSPEIDAELQNLVESAFPNANCEVIAETETTPPAYVSSDAASAWQAMHDRAQGREIDVLLEMLGATWLTGEERWKAVTFLGMTLATPEAAAQREAIVTQLGVDAIVKQRGSAAGDAVRIQGAALDAIAKSDLPPEEKWQFLLDTIQHSRSYFREIVVKLREFRPGGTAAGADAMPILLDAMVRSDRAIDLDTVAELVRELDVRTAAADLRRLLLAAHSHLSARIASILADWGDTEASFEIRRAINQYSTASDPNVDVLVDALWRLEGAENAEYIAEVFRSAPPALQEHLIHNSFRSIASPLVVQAVRDIAATTSDVELREAANAYLAALPVEEAAAEDALPEATDATASQADSTAGPTAAAASAAASASAATVSGSAAAASSAATTAAATSAAVTESKADSDGWAPTYEGERIATARTVTTPTPPPPPEPVSEAEEGGAWRPVGEMTGDPEIDGGYVVDAEGRSRRLGVEAEALAIIRQEAAQAAAEARARAEAEAAGEGGPDPIEFLVKLPMILFAVAVVGALLVILLRGGE